MPSINPADSSSIESASYDAAKRELTVVFKSSDTRYVYLDVPPEKWAELEAADSKGAFVNREIKPHYTVRKD